MKRSTSALIFAVKFAVTIGLIAYLLGKVDIRSVLAQIITIRPAWAAIAAMVVLLQLALVSFRWLLVSRLVDARMRMGQVFRLTLIGQFFNQVLPSAFGGDAVRAWLASREGIPLGRAVTGILCDRAVGMVTLVLIISCTFFLLPGYTGNKLPATEVFRIVSVLGLFGLAALFFLGIPLARFLMRYRLTDAAGKLIRDLRSVLYSRTTSIAIIGLAGAVQVLLVLVIYLCARGMNIQIDFGAAFLVVPAIMLVSMIPISFAGWGVREGAMIFGLGLLGIATPDALAVSVAFGLLQIVVAVPGGVLWLARDSAARTVVVRPEDSR
jgi:uncharacterized protein (TIRG00374 family)